MKAKTLLAEAVRELKASEAIDHWQKSRERYEAEDLMIHLMGGYWPDPDDEITPAKEKRYREMIARRVTGEPIAHIKGFAEFLGYDMVVKPGVFVPRDSSEWMATQAIRRLSRRRNPVHIDLATGMGTIALAASARVPRAEVFGTDISKEAIENARLNARRLKVKAKFGVGDLFAPVPKRLRGKVSVITVHPPYVAKGELEDLPGEIIDWEPAHTLTDNSVDGLGIVRRTVEEAPQWLAPGGWLLMEVDPDRSRGVMPIYREGGFRDVRSTVGGPLRVTRVIVGRLPG